MEFFTMTIATGGIICSFSYVKQKIERSYDSYRNGYSIFDFREGYPY